MKKYPFSVAKHAHDIELAKTVAFNLIYDMENGDRPYNERDIERLERIREDCQNILDRCNTYPVAMLEGIWIGKAKELVLWAGCYRADRSTGKRIY